VTSNCLIFAIQHLFKCGGFIIARKSHYGFWPHFLWSKDLKEFEEFHPLGAKHHRWFPPLIFRGYIRHTTANQQKEKHG